MNLYVDLDTLQLRSSATDARLVSFLDAKRGDALPLTIRFYQAGSIVRLDATTTINFALKEEGKYDQDPLVLESSFTASAVGSPDSDPNYTATPSLNTGGLNALFNIDGDSSNDPATVRLMGELTWQATGDTGPTSIKTFVVRMANDVYRGDETAPTTLETPLEWLTARLSERNIQPVRSSASTLFPLSLTPSGTLIGDDTNPITLDDLDNINITGDTVEGDAEWQGTLPDTGSLTLNGDGTTWSLVYSGPSTASDITMTVTSSKKDPTGLTLTDGGSNTITITATSGLQAPQVGDIGYVTGTEIFYFWNGTGWEKLTKDCVLLTGNQTITGNKTFSGAIVSSDRVSFTPQASAPSSPAAGDVYFDSTLTKLRCYDGTSWNNLF